jgi:hypothetical protein
MPFTRATSGLLIYDGFGTDTRANYSQTGSGTWTVTGGKLHQDAGGMSSRRQSSISTAGCVTAGHHYTFNDKRSVLTLATATAGQYSLYRGYFVQKYQSTITLQKCVNDTTITALATLGSTGITGDTPQGLVSRVYRAGNDVYGRIGATALVNVGSASDTAFTSSLSGAVWMQGLEDIDWLDIRTSHLISCSGMTDGWYLRVSDGVTAAEAVASGGTATVDAGAVLFPLSSVGIYTAASGGGSKIAEITSAALADMGGGDAFTYHSPHNLAMMGCGTA